jgi:hypothetical protein
MTQMMHLDCSYCAFEVDYMLYIDIGENQP